VLDGPAYGLVSELESFPPIGLRRPNIRASLPILSPAEAGLADVDTLTPGLRRGLRSFARYRALAVELLVDACLFTPVQLNWI